MITCMWKGSLDDKPTDNYYPTLFPLTLQSCIFLLSVLVFGAATLLFLLSSASSSFMFYGKLFWDCQRKKVFSQKWPRDEQISLLIKLWLQISEFLLYIIIILLKHQSALRNIQNRFIQNQLLFVFCSIYSKWLQCNFQLSLTEMNYSLPQ